MCEVDPACAAIDNIPNTLGLIEKDGTINYSNVTNFSAADYAGYLSFGQKLGKSKYWNIGANAKVVRRVVGKFANSWGFGLDVGVSYQKNNTYFSDVITIDALFLTFYWITLTYI